MGELLRKANVEPTSRSVSSSKSSKRTPDLAQLISKATRDSKRQAQEEKVDEIEEEEGEESGFYKRNFQYLKLILVAFNVYTKKSLSFEIFSWTELIIPSTEQVATQQQQQHSSGRGGRGFRFNPRGNRGGGRGGGYRGGRGGRSSNKSGEIDPYDMTIAPLNIYENQVLPVGLHNLSKSFRPNLSTIRVLSLGTKFIPKWKFEKRNTAFLYFKDFLRKMQNKVYFTETKPGFFEKNSKFKVKTN